jgi:hypothetical protein
MDHVGNPPPEFYFIKKLKNLLEIFEVKILVHFFNRIFLKMINKKKIRKIKIPVFMFNTFFTFYIIFNLIIK